MRLTVPKLPHYEYLESLSKDDAEGVMKQWEQDCENVRELNEAQFEKDLRKIKLCAFLHGVCDGLSRGFSMSVNSTVKFRDPYVSAAHYSWCPWDEWMDNSGKYLKIEIADRPK